MSAPNDKIANQVRQYPSKGKEPAITDIPGDKQISIFNASAVNNAGQTEQVGILRLLTLAKVRLYSLVGGVYTELDLKNLLAGLPVIGTTIGDGFAVGAKSEPHLVGVTVSATGAGGTFKRQYSKDAATFIDLPAGSEIEAPTNYAVAADAYHVLQSPIDQTRGGPAVLDQSLYYTQIVSTVAQAGVVSINDLWVGTFLTLWNEVVNGNAAFSSFDWRTPYPLDGSDNIIPYFSVPSSANRTSIFYMTTG